MAQRIQLRRGTAAEWSEANPVLAVGEPGVESDTGRQKFGDGVTPWNSRPYASKGDKGDQGAPGVADDTSVAALFSDPNSQTRAAGNATYASAFADSQSITYDGSGNVSTVTDNGITTTYTYNADGTVATDSRTVNGVTTTRNYGYTNGNLTSITKAA